LFQRVGPEPSRHRRQIFENAVTVVNDGLKERLTGRMAPAAQMPAAVGSRQVFRPRFARGRDDGRPNGSRRARRRRTRRVARKRTARAIALPEPAEFQTMIGRVSPARSGYTEATSADAPESFKGLSHA